MADNSDTRPRRGLPIRAVDVVDFLVYVVVLNLAAQYVPVVITETFTMSLLTALLLKVVLEVILLVKKPIKAKFTSASTGVGKFFAGLLLWGLLISSKFVVLELVALIFGDSVSLGGFWSVNGLIVILMLARSGVRRMLVDGGPDEALS